MGHWIKTIDGIEYTVTPFLRFRQSDEGKILEQMLRTIDGFSVWFPVELYTDAF